METLVLENQYKIVVPIFGAAYAAPNKGTTIFYWFRSLSTVLSSTENGRIQGLFKAFEWFSVLFKADTCIIFKDISRKPSKFKYISSLCKPWRIITWDVLWHFCPPFWFVISACFCRHLLIFFKIGFFFKKKSGTLSECQTVWIQIRTDILSVLI